MNVGGHRLTNEELEGHFRNLGCTDVSTFRASGNVIFTGTGSVAQLRDQLERGLAGALGYDVPAFLREGEEIREIAEASPFEPDLVAASAGKLQVGLLAASPASSARREALALSSERDRLALSGRQLYWLPDGGFSDAELDLRVLAGILGPMTLRTKGTIELVAQKHFSG
jgi:uncharacterized protein (DUF1697 family)